MAYGQFVLDPEIVKAATQVGGSLITAVSSLWGGDKASEAFKQQAKIQAQALKKQLAMQQAGLSAAAQQQILLERQHADQLAYEAAMKQRSQQIAALYAVGGVALLVGGFFIVKAMTKNSKSKKK